MVTIIKRRKGKVNFFKQKAHTSDDLEDDESQPVEERMNKVSDAQAMKGRVEGTVELTYPIFNLEPAFLRVKGEIVEGKIFGKVMWLMDDEAIYEDIKRSVSARYAVLDQPEVWKAGSDITAADVRKHDAVVQN
jgi:hypothetical protein